MSIDTVGVLTSVAYFAAALIVSGYLGYLLVRARWPSRPWVRAVLSVAASLTVLAVSAIFYLLRLLTVPALDSPAFQRRQGVSIEVRSASGPRGVIVLDVPAEVRVNDDARVELRFEGSGAQPGQVAYVRVGPEVKVRAAAPCTAASQASAPDLGVAACATQEAEGKRFRWFLRAEKDGLSAVVIAWKSAAGDALASPDWRAVDRDAQSPRQSQFYFKKGDESDPNLVITPEHPSANIRMTEVNLRDREFTHSLLFTTTLGMSGATYAALGAVGSVLSALLGGGWLLKLLEWVRGRKSATKEPGNPFPPLDGPS